MGRMIVIYKTPTNTIDFDKHYYQIHVPLAKKLPGLIKYEVSKRSIVSPTSDSGIYLIGILYFENLDAIKKAFASPEGQACAADRKLLAPKEKDAEIYLFDTNEV